MLNYVIDPANGCTGTIMGTKFNISVVTEDTKTVLESTELALEKCVTGEEATSIVSGFMTYLETAVDKNVLSQYENENLFFNAYTKTYHVGKEVDGKQVVSKIAIPESLVTKMVEMHEKGMGITPMINACILFQGGEKFLFGKNDRASHYEYFANTILRTFTDEAEALALMESDGLTKELAMEKATYQDVMLTKQGFMLLHKVVAESKEVYKAEFDADGVFIGKKLVPRHEIETLVDPETGEITQKEGVTYIEERVFRPAIHRNGDDFDLLMPDGEISHGQNIKVGGEVSHADWGKVNCYDDVACVPGHHVGGLSYIDSWMREGRETLNVLVDPGMVGAIPADDAMRVKAYYVYSAKMPDAQKGFYHSASYETIRISDRAESLKRILEQADADKENVTDLTSEMKLSL